MDGDILIITFLPNPHLLLVIVRFYILAYSPEIIKLIYLYTLI